jgi:hypothetical protein
VEERQRLHDWERAAARHVVLQRRLDGTELAAPVEKVAAGQVQKGGGRHGGERGTIERKASGSAQWRRRLVKKGGQEVKMVGGMCGRNLAGSRHCSEYFFF